MEEEESKRVTIDIKGYDPNTHVSSEDIVKGKAPRRRKHSIYHWVVNSNEAFTDQDSDRYREKETIMINVLNEMVSGKQSVNFSDYIVWKEEEGEWFKNVKKFYFRARAEKGPEQNRLHFHILIDLFHNTLLRINYDKFKEAFEKALGHKVACYYDVYSKVDLNIQNYITKYYKENKKN